MRGNGIAAYKEASVLTADPKRLVIMCYDGAIRNLKIAKESCGAGKYESKAKAVQKAQDIISELMHALNFEKGGQIAKNLEALYNYMQRRLLDAEVHKDIEAFDEVGGILKELRGAWQEAFFGAKQEIGSPAHRADEMNKPAASVAIGS